MRGLFQEAVMDGAGTARRRRKILRVKSNEEGSGILGVAVKCVVSERNTRGGGGFLDIN